MQPSSLVVCVNDVFRDSNHLKVFDKRLVKGELYVVREVIPDCFNPNEEPGISVEEIRGRITCVKCHDGKVRAVEYHFYMHRFVEVLPPINIEEALLLEAPELV